jgi:transcriptional regulator
MYNPESFKESDAEGVSAFVAQYSFGMLITVSDGMPTVSHLPLIFDPIPGSGGKLSGHLARANPQWQHLLSGKDVLVVFSGPHAYVSPSWYTQTGVPTWNYTVVHMRGKPRVIDDTIELEALLDRQTRIYEESKADPWRPDFKVEPFSRLTEKIVGFEIVVGDIEAKFKLSQNRPAADQHNVIDRLKASGHQVEAELAGMMLERVLNNR